MTSPLETYLTRLGRELTRRGLADARILEEARGHLTDATEQAIARGLSRDEAEREAVARFGEAHMVAVNFAPERSQILNRLLLAVALLVGLVRRLFEMTMKSPSGGHGDIDFNGAQTVVFHDRPATFHFALKGKKGWVNPELVAVLADPGAQLGPFLERAVPPPLGPLGALKSVALLDEGAAQRKGTRRYRASFGDDEAIVCTVTLASDGTSVFMDWSRTDPTKP